MSKYRYITNNNINCTGKKVKEVNGHKLFTVKEVGKNLITITNDFGFAQHISRQAFKDFYVVQEVE